MNPAWLSSLPQWGAGGVGVGAGIAAGLYFIRWLIEFVGGRMDRREARLDKATQEIFTRLETEVKRLTERCGTLEERVQQTEDELAERKTQHEQCEARCIRLEAMLQGYGDAKQTAALIIAAEKAEGQK